MKLLSYVFLFIDPIQAYHDQELVIVAQLVVLEFEKNHHNNQQAQTNENELGDVAHFHGQIGNFVLVK